MPLLKTAAPDLKPQQLTFVIAAYAKANQPGPTDAPAKHARRISVLADEKGRRFYDALEASGLRQIQAFRPETLALFLCATVDLRGAAAARRTLLSPKGIHALCRLGATLPEVSSSPCSLPPVRLYRTLLHPVLLLLLLLPMMIILLCLRTPCSLIHLGC